MEKIGFWQIDGEKLIRVSESKVELEQKLENWIEIDPSIIALGLIIIGRQIELESGRLDLLGLDPQGSFVIIEIKRGELRREAIAQAIDYSSCIAELSESELKEKVNSYLEKKNTNLEALLSERSAEESLQPGDRSYSIIIVGTSSAPGLERMTRFLSENLKVPITTITFQVFESSHKMKYLAREINEEAYKPPEPPMAIDKVLQIAELNQTKKYLEELIQITEKYGFYARPCKKSIMFTSPEKKNTTIFTVWAERKASKIRIWGDNQLLNNFFSYDQATEENLFSKNGMNDYTDVEFEALIKNLAQVLEKVKQKESD